MNITRQQIEELVRANGTPLYVYSKNIIINQAKAMLSVPAPYGLTVRYAMKANPHPEIIKILDENNIYVDASSGYEAANAIDLGVNPEHILLTSQELAHNLDELVNRGVEFNATSLHQLEEFGKKHSGKDVSIRINPGIGSGHSVKTNVGGRTSSFGIWHEYIDEVHGLCQKYELRVKRLHTHIGSGTDPAVWQEAIRISLELIKNFPEATILNLGGGFKVARMPEETGADMKIIGNKLASELEQFRLETTRKLHLELEPGTFLVASAGELIATVMDIVDTGDEGYTFLRVNTGMNDILRPSLYGAQHPIDVLNHEESKSEYVVVGHNCESGDLLTPAPNDPEVLRPRLLNTVTRGDRLVIGGAGAYCAAMSARGYNSFPNAAEVVV